jgi:hypothetical protein
LDVCFVNERTYIPIVPESESGFSLDDRITPVLSEEPFLSVRQVAKKVVMLKSIVRRHLTQTMRQKLRHLKGLPHSLTESGKMNRAQRATALLELPQAIIDEMWQYIVTLDDSCFIERLFGNGSGLQRMMSRE